MFEKSHHYLSESVPEFQKYPVHYPERISNQPAKNQHMSEVPEDQFFNFPVHLPKKQSVPHSAASIFQNIQNTVT